MSTRSRTLIAAALAVLALLLAPLPRAEAADSKTAIFAGGCFWCVEADFDKVKGVVSTTSGYIGGSADTAHYKQVSNGGTGHYEAVKVVYDPAQVSYDRLLHVFWRTVDPTDGGGQFCDRGDSYKTAVFVADESERKEAEASRQEAQKTLGQEIVTPIVNATPFYDAEGYHQDYYTKNPVRYKIYRYGCGRDARVEELWGKQAHAGLYPK